MKTALGNKKKLLPGQKGFLGPIGDDLPSLIPLLFSLVMFFSTFTYAFNSFELRNNAFSNDLSVLKISAIIKSNGYIENYGTYSKRCLTIGPAGINYYSAVTNALTAKNQFLLENSISLEDYKGIDLENLKPFKLGGSLLECKNADISEMPNFFGVGTIVKIFPIAVEDNKVVKPMHLVVVAWK